MGRPPTAALCCCRCLPARLLCLQATMQFEPIIILSSILAVVQIILTMLPGVYYTRQVCSSKETHAMSSCWRAALSHTFPPHASPPAPPPPFPSLPYPLVGLGQHPHPALAQWHGL
jgi:hypothetical protein